MKQWGIYIAAAIALTLVAVVAMNPSYRQRRLMSQLQHAPESAEKARLIRDIIDLDATSAGGFLEQYALHNPTVAFDPRHVVGLVLDTTSGNIDTIGVDNDFGRYFIGIGEKLEEVELLLSNDQRAYFVLRTNDGHGNQKYAGFDFIYDKGALVDFGGFDVISPDEITQWQAEGIWPF